MNRSLGSLLLVTFGFGALGLHCAPSQSQKQDCTPFPPPSPAAGGTCATLPGRTLLHDLGSLEPGGGDTLAAMTVDDAALYFTASDPGAAVPTLFRMPKGGGALQALDDGVSAPIVLDGASLVYTRMTSHPQSGGVGFAYPNLVRLGAECATAALPNPGGDVIPGMPTVDGAGGVSWLEATPNATALLHWDPATNKTSSIASIASDATSLIGDADNLYWSVASGASVVAPGGPPSGGTTAIMTMPSIGGTPRGLGAISGALEILAADDDSLYLGPPAYSEAPSGGLTRVSKADGSIRNEIPAGASSGSSAPIVAGYVAHDTNLYWAQGATVQRAPKSGGPPEVILDLADPSSTVLSVAVDDCNVYFNVSASTPSTYGYAIWGQPLPSASPATLGDASVSTEDASVPTSPDDAATQDGSVTCASATGPCKAVAPGG